jgi:hypothetical protein
MRIIDTFLFSEPFEKEVLLVKFNSGGDRIHEWVLIENSYTHQGDYKGLYAAEMLASDDRFKPFLSRIKVISGDLVFKKLDYDNKASDKQGISQEWQQRDLVKEYLLEKYAEGDYFLISDTDECLDLSSSDENYHLLISKIKENRNGVTQIPRRRYWYDFDNVWNESRSVPIVSLTYLKLNSTKSLGEIRVANFGPCKPWERWILFEYSFCFSRDLLLRKYQTFAHVGIYDEDIDIALKCNHIPVIKGDRDTISRNPKFWLTKVQLNESNSPAYVRANYSMLRTDIVDVSYITNRKLYYSNVFSIMGLIAWRIEHLRIIGGKIVDKLKKLLSVS